MSEDAEVNWRDMQPFLCEFIEMYRSFPCLWKFDCKYYRDRYVKERAYAALTAKMREVDPRADKNSVMRKINALRTAFRREYKKVRRANYIAKNSLGKYSKPKCVSSLWYFDLLKFVVEQQNEPEPSEPLALDESFSEEQADVSYASIDDEEKLVHREAEHLMEFLEDTVSFFENATF